MIRNNVAFFETELYGQPYTHVFLNIPLREKYSLLKSEFSPVWLPWQPNKTSDHDCTVESSTVLFICTISFFFFLLSVNTHISGMQHLILTKLGDNNKHLKEHMSHDQSYEFPVNTTMHRSRLPNFYVSNSEKFP